MDIQSLPVSHLNKKLPRVHHYCDINGLVHAYHNVGHRKMCFKYRLMKIENWVKWVPRPTSKALYTPHAIYDIRET